MDLSAVRSRLEARLGELTARVTRIEGRLRAPGHRDSEEQAQETEDDEVLERLGEAEAREIEGIRHALHRIDAGTYGTCVRCGGPIDGRRLEALPFATLCIRCAG